MQTLYGIFSVIGLWTAGAIVIVALTIGLKTLLRRGQRGDHTITLHCNVCESKCGEWVAYLRHQERGEAGALDVTHSDYVAILCCPCADLLCEPIRTAVDSVISSAKQEA